jgi:hypothetical protein
VQVATEIQTKIILRMTLLYKLRSSCEEKSQLYHAFNDYVWLVPIGGFFFQNFGCHVQELT